MPTSPESVSISMMERSAQGSWMPAAFSSGGSRKAMGVTRTCRMACEVVMASVDQHARQPERERGHVGHEHQADGEGAVEGQDGAHHLSDRYFADGAAHELGRSHWRRVQAQRTVD